MRVYPWKQGVCLNEHFKTFCICKRSVLLPYKIMPYIGTDMRHRKESLEETGASKHPQWSFGTGLYPLQALVHPIELRFRYHFMGTKGTNRIDKVIPSHYSFSNKCSLRYSQNGLLPIFLTRCTFTRHSLPLTFKHSRLRPGTLQ